MSADWSGKTLANYRGPLASIINDAIRAGLVTANATAGIRLPGATQGEMTSLTPDEFAHIHAHAPAFGKDLLTVLVGTGLRIGEATALQVRDFDPGAGTLTVARAWKSVSVLGPPKTRKSRRTIHVPGHVANALTRAAAGRSSDDWLYVTPTR